MQEDVQAQHEDYVHEYAGDATMGRVRIRVYRRVGEGETPVIVCTQLPTNRWGPSPTIYAEQLVAEVVERNPIELPGWWRRSGATGDIARWVEHFPIGLSLNGAETFDAVVCCYRRRRRGQLEVRSPRWTRTTRDEVERMIGLPLDV